MNQPENTGLAPSSSNAAKIIDFVFRRCSLMYYEPTNVEFRGSTDRVTGLPTSATVELSTLLQFPPSEARGTVHVSRGQSLTSILRDVASALDAMHCGVSADDQAEVS